MGVEVFLGSRSRKMYACQSRESESNRKKNGVRVELRKSLRVGVKVVSIFLRLANSGFRAPVAL